MLRYGVYGAFGLTGLILVALATILIGSELKLRDVGNPPIFNTPLPTDAASLQRGEYIAQTRGCTSCHSPDLSGYDFSEIFDYIGRPIAVNLGQYLRTHDDATFDRALRHNIGVDGKKLAGMPSFNFYNLTDEDVAALLAWLRSIEPVENDLPPTKLSLTYRAAVLFDVEPDFLAVLPPLESSTLPTEALMRGEYLAMTSCNECHGLDLRGLALFGFITPDLGVMSQAYSDEDFTRLLREGTSMGGVDLGLMSQVSQSRYSHFSDEDIADLLAYLRYLADTPRAEDVVWRAD